MVNKSSGNNVHRLSDTKWYEDSEERWGDMNPNNISNGEVADVIEMFGTNSDQSSRSDYDEYRDERDGSERLADRYNC